MQARLKWGKNLFKKESPVNGACKKSEIKVSEEDEVVLDGNRISQAPEFVYYLLHKPAGHVSATEDKRDKTVMELVASDRKGLFPVGRLDKDTEGLLRSQTTNTGMNCFLQRNMWTRPIMRLQTDVWPRGCAALQMVWKSEKNPTMPAKLEILSTRKVEVTGTGTVPVRMVIRNSAYDQRGKFHQVKRMTEAVGKVVYLKRISMGYWHCRMISKRRECRQLTVEEEKRLKESCHKNK